MKTGILAYMMNYVVAAIAARKFNVYNNTIICLGRQVIVSDDLVLGLTGIPSSMPMACVCQFKNRSGSYHQIVVNELAAASTTTHLEAMIAHEIAHEQLGHLDMLADRSWVDVVLDSIGWNSTVRYDQFEYEADRLAVELYPHVDYVGMMRGLLVAATSHSWLISSSKQLTLKGRLAAANGRL